MDSKPDTGREVRHAGQRDYSDGVISPLLWRKTEQATPAGHSTRTMYFLYFRTCMYVCMYKYVCMYVCVYVCMYVSLSPSAHPLPLSLSLFLFIYKFVCLPV